MRQVEYDASIGVVVRDGNEVKTRLPSREVLRLLDENEAIIKLLEDVPGDTALEKVIKLKSWYQELSNVVDAINGARSV